MKKLPALPDTELPFLSQMLAKDAKNYHVWTYRVWMVKYFELWPTPENPGPELDFTHTLIQRDVMNNSAWSHRYTVQFDRDKLDPNFTFDAKNVPDKVWEREISVAQKCINYMPQNQSPWWYLRGVVEKKGDSITTMKDFALKFADMDKLETISSSFALQLLVDIYKLEKDIPRVRQAYELLASRFDPIRRNYYRWLLSYVKDEEAQGQRPEDEQAHKPEIAA
jgi:protein farnesyltransferase/geranylgeranyltransferase type-1 subunit alpha